MLKKQLAFVNRRGLWCERSVFLLFCTFTMRFAKNKAKNCFIAHHANLE